MPAGLPRSPAKLALLAVRGTLCFLVAVNCWLAALGLVAALLLNVVNPPWSTLQAYRRVLSGHPVQPVEWTPLDRMPWTLQALAVAAEDPNFWKHWGIDVGALREAHRVNTLYKQPLLGGSTIPQQLARTLFLFPDKWVLRKWAEIVLAVELDLLLSKRRLLELYLNSVEWGRGVFGIGAAARVHFRKKPAALTAEETVRLITTLPSPIRSTPHTFWQRPDLASRYHRLAELFLVVRRQEPTNGTKPRDEASTNTPGTNRRPAETVRTNAKHFAPGTNAPAVRDNLFDD